MYAHPWVTVREANAEALIGATKARDIQTMFI
jgi:hypothetical protein